LRKLEIKLAEFANPEFAARWISKTLSTITSKVFTDFAIRFSPFHTGSENQARWWNSVDDMLDRFDPCVTLVLEAKHRAGVGKTGDLVEMYFPSMWKKGKVVFTL